MNLDFASILDGIQDAVAVLDREWRYVYVNASAAHLSGMVASEMRGKTIWELFPSVVGSEMERACRDAMAGTARRFEFYFPSSGKWFDQRVQPIADGILIWSTDASAHHEDELRLQSVLASVPDSIACISRDWRITYMNPRGLAIMRRSSDQVVGTPVWEAFSIYRGTAVEFAVENAMLHGLGTQFTFLGVTTGRWHHTIIHPTIDGVVIMSRDVHDQVETVRLLRARDNDLRAGEKRFRSLAESMPQIVWTAKPDGTINFINQRWVDFTGATLEQTNDLAVVEKVFHPDDTANAFSRWAYALAHGTPHEVQWRFRRASDGAYRWFLTRALPVRDDSGQIVEWFGTATDIHEQKLAEEALRETDRRKNEFLATLAHELRNPLNPLVTATSLLKTSTSPASRQKAEQVIDRQLSHLVRLVDDLLDLERITHDRLELRRETFDIARAIDSALETAKPAIAARSHQMTIHPWPEPLWVHADFTRIAQAIANLLTNAAKYTDPHGSIALEARKENADVVVVVRDNGIGIDAAHLPRVFEMFSQLEPALDRSQGGLGIGLALVRSLVEMHGGAVTARSEGSRRGSEFVIRLPAATTVPIPHAFGDRTTFVRPKRVLVVDDLADAASTIADLLRMYGHEVETANDGPSALERVRTFEPDVVLLDIGLPRMNGYEVAERIRAEHAKNILLVALTGWGQQADKDRALSAGFDHHLTKPLDADTLRKVLSL